MSETFIYIILGVFDSLACLLLVLKIFMLPIWDYRYKIIGYCLLSSLSSYLVRIVLDMPRLDTPLQFLYCILFLRFLLHMRTHLSAFAAGTGFTLYINLQLLIFFLAASLGIAGNSVILDTAGFSVHFIQIMSILFAYLVAFVLYRYNLGFSFIIQPPHDFFKREDYKSSLNVLLLAGVVISIMTICLTIFFLYNMNPYGTIAITLIAFSISYYFSQRGDYEDARKSIEAHSQRNKKS